MNLRLAGVIFSAIAVPASGAGLVTGVRLTESPTQPPTPPAQIAARYAPYLIQNSGELFHPVDRAAYVGLTSLYTLQNGERQREVKTPHLRNLPATPLCRPTKPGCYYYLGVRDHDIRDGPHSYLDIQSAIDKQEPRPVVYWSYQNGHHTIQYWFFYVFNYFQNWHESDWEEITLELADDQPSRVGFSSHNGGQSVEWSALEDGRGRVGDHVVVFVAKGSHANYFRPGKQRPWECLKFCKDQSDGCGDILEPTNYTLRQFEPYIFSGDYSSGNYILKGRKRVHPKKINVGDPQARPKTFDNPLVWLNGTRKTAPTTSESWCRKGKT